MSLAGAPGHRASLEQYRFSTAADRADQHSCDDLDPIQSLFFKTGQQRKREGSRSSQLDPRKPPSSNTGPRPTGRVSSTMAGVSPSGDSFYGGGSSLGSRGSRIGAGGFIMRSESIERLDDSEGEHEGPPGEPGIDRCTGEESRGPTNVGPVDRLLQLVDDGQSLSRRVLGNERQATRLGERLSALKTPLWQLQARVRTQGERPPEFIRDLAEQVSHCLDVLLELTHPEWWNQIRRKVKQPVS